MKLIDTVVPMGALNPSDRHHMKATKHLASLSKDPEVALPISVVFEVDLTLKARGYTHDERRQTWLELSPKLPAGKIIPQTAVSMAAASSLESEGMDYFDALVVAQALELQAVVITNDQSIARKVATVW